MKHRIRQVQMIAAMLLSLLFLFSACKVEFPDDLAVGEDPGASFISSRPMDLENSSDIPAKNESSNSSTSSPSSQLDSSDVSSPPLSSSASGASTTKPQHNAPPTDGKGETVSKAPPAPSSSSNTSSSKDQYQTDPIPDGKPKPVEPDDTTVDQNKKLQCTLSITCNTILDNLESLNPSKLSVLPKDGVILAQRTVTFYQGESVFDVLLRETKRNRIHMEFTTTPIYNSNYIEGINNLYEKDCGELSGWMYRVNGWFPNYGCSRYQLQDGDVVEWVYTCDLGKDVGDNYLGEDFYQK